MISASPLVTCARINAHFLTAGARRFGARPRTSDSAERREAAEEEEGKEKNRGRE